MLKISINVCLFFLFSSTYLLSAEENKITLPLEELQTFGEVFQHIQTSYHKEISDKELINAAISGMLKRLGEHTRYYSEQEFTYFNTASDGEQTGALLPSVTAQILPSRVGYLSISQFTKRSPDEVTYHLNKLIRKHNTTKLIIDLRNNLGGVLNASVDIANLFLKEGLIYSSRGKSIESNRNITADKSTLFKNIPLLIMINKDSASSSEILIGALQDNKRALIIGESSYGKGTIQTVFSLRNGGAIKMTTSEYFTPNGNKIQRKGITPEIKFDTENLTNESNNPIFNDLQIYQAYLQLVAKVDTSE